MRIVYGWLGGLCLLAGMIAFVLSFRLMMRFDVFPSEWFPAG